MIQKLKVKIKDELQTYSHEFPVSLEKLVLSKDDAFLESLVNQSLKAIPSIAPKEIKVCVEYVW